MAVEWWMFGVCMWIATGEVYWLSIGLMWAIVMDDDDE